MLFFIHVMNAFIFFLFKKVVCAGKKANAFNSLHHSMIKQMNYTYRSNYTYNVSSLDLKAFERRLTEYIACLQPATGRWRSKFDVPRDTLDSLLYAF